MSLSRRELLGLSAAALPGIRGEFTGQRAARRAKNIIFCVSDGCAMSVITIADHLQQVLSGRRGYWAWLTQQPFATTGLQDTRSLSSIVTDSSAASSSWGSGRRIWNGQVNVYPDGTALRPLTQILGDAGVRCGLVTTTTITHATPAGFAVSCDSRDQEALIAERYLKASVDVLLGGGDRFFAASRRTDGKDLYAEYQRAGFAVVKDRDSLLGRKAKKLLGIFSDSHLPYSVDRDHDASLKRQVPTLAEMARVAIENLNAGSPNGFVLQIEGGKVDHGCHANDLAAAVYDQLAFEDAVKVAVDFARKDGNTLVVVTSDHATGGPALNGAGEEYFDSTGGHRLLTGMRASYGVVTPEITRDPRVSTVQAVVEHYLGVKLTALEAQAVADSAKGAYALGESEFMRSLNSTLAAMLGNHTKVGWTSLNHTSDHVLVTAVGPGREHFAGLVDNFRMFDILLGLKGLKWENPQMSFADALRHHRAKQQG